MDIGTKLEYIKQHIAGIVTHDDAPIEEIGAALTDLAEHIAAQAVAFVERRAAIAAVEREAQSVSADEVGDAAKVLGL